MGNVRAVVIKNEQNLLSLTGATDYYPFGMPMPGRQIVNGQPYRYSFQGQEKDPETGKEAFELRLWDSRIGRWLTTDPARQYPSPYLGMGNNPINGIDLDGGEWEPDENGNLVAQKGDNAQTLADFKGITLKEAQKLIADQGLFTDFNTGQGTDLIEGQVLTLDNVFTRSLANFGSLPSGNSSLNWNCWGSCISGVAGIELGNGVGIDTPNIFDNYLNSNFTSISPSNAKFGETIIRFSTSTPYASPTYDPYVAAGLVSRNPNNVGGSLHGAVYYGTSQDGTVYVYSKNGWNRPPIIMKIDQLRTDPSLNYGSPRGLGGSSGFYNKN